MKIPAKILPPVFHSHELAGQVTKKAAEFTGLRVGTPVVMGSGDGLSTLLGLGIVRQNQVGITVGTAGVVGLSSDDYLYDSKGRCLTFVHAVPHKWYLCAATYASGASLDWYMNNFVHQSLRKPEESYKLIEAHTRRSSPGAKGIIFLPLLSGSRSPYNNPSGKGVFFGAKLWHTQADFTQAVLEGIVFEIYDCYRVIKEVCSKATGCPVREIRLSGGIVNNPIWKKILANIFGESIQIPTVEELGTLGCAINAAVGVGLYGDYEEAIKSMVHTEQIVQPDLVLHRTVYQGLFEIYRRIYNHLSTDFRDIETMGW